MKSQPLEIYLKPHKIRSHSESKVLKIGQNKPQIIPIIVFKKKIKIDHEIKAIGNISIHIIFRFIPIIEVLKKHFIG